MFTTELYLKDTGNGKTFIVRQPLRYVYQLQYRIAVPDGFETDLASIPWPLTLLVPKIGRFNSAAVVHDYLYRGGSITTFDRYEEKAIDATRELADKIFMDAMRSSGVGYVRRQMIYAGVRAAGWRYWKKCKGCN